MDIPLIVLALSLIILFLFYTRQQGSENQKGSVIRKNNNPSNLYKEWQTKNYFFSKAELFFYRELIKYAEQKNILILSKVRIADLVTTKHHLAYANYMKTFRRITQKHVDYVVTDYSGKILCVLELDGKSHESGKTMENDKFKNEFFESIDLKLIRFQNYGVHNLSQLDNIITH